MKNRRKLIILTAATLSLASPAAPSFAQVTIDPGSPTAKEYGIPLEDARRDAESGGDSDAPVAQGDRSAALFGEGVGDEPASSAESSAPSNVQENERDESEGSKPSGTEESPSRGGDVFAGTGRPVSATVPQGGFDSALTIGALALSVLLLGGVIGSIARRRTS